jgi:hypothetical protein
MAAGALNPKDNTRTTTVRPAEVNSGANARKWASDGLGTIVYAQDLNRIIAMIRALADFFSVPDVEGDDDYLLDAITAAIQTRQAAGVNLDGLRALVSAANKVPFFTDDVGSMDLATLTSFGAQLIACANSAGGRTLLGLGGAAPLDVGDGLESSGGALRGLYRVLYALPAPVATGSGTTEQTLGSYTLPASFLARNGQIIRVKAYFQHTVANSHIVTNRLKFGGSPGNVQTNITTLSNGVSCLTADIQRRGSNAQNIMQHGFTPGSPPALISPSFVGSTETDTSTISIVATAQDGSNSAGDSTLQSFTVEAIN